MNERDSRKTTLITRRVAARVAALDPWLLAAVALGAWLRFSRLGDFDNQYYTATVSSMLHSARNFFFASFDPFGVVTVDKPPVSFWVQAVPAALFGPERWAVVLPQAIAGSLAMVILYMALKPAFGRAAAVAAAFALAVIPASVVIDSRNEPDSLLSFVLLLAAASAILAVKTQRWRWLVAFAVLIGVAFNIKMLVAFVPLPAFLLYYMLASKQPVRRTVVRSAVAVAVLLAVAFSWSTVVALTPPEQRPYVGSTRDNSIWTLVFGYNGLQRFTSFIGPRPPQAQQGQAPPLQGGPPPQGALPSPGSSQPQPPAQAFAPPNTGLLALFQQRLIWQTGWLLPLGLLMLLVSMATLLPEAVYRRPAALFELLREAPAASQVILWGGWFATAVLVFGMASSTTTHPYYLMGLAVPMAATLGIGLSILWRAFQGAGVLAWLLPAILLGGALYQVVAARDAVPDWAVALALVATFVAAPGMVIAVWRALTDSPLAKLFAAVGALAILVIPSAVARAAGPAMGPLAGPNPSITVPRPNPPLDRIRLIADFIDQQAEEGSAIATVSAQEAAPLINRGVPAVAIGGFSGNDPIFTPESFQAMAKQSEVRYFLMPADRGPGEPGGPAGRGATQEAILSYVRRAWTDVSSRAGLPPGALYQFAGPGKEP